MIDFVIMRRDQRQLSTDVRVYRSACCWTDHYLMKGLGFSRMHRNSATHVPLAVHLLRGQEVRDKYQQSLDQHLSWCQHTAEWSVEEQWQMLKDCIMMSAEEAIGRGWKK